MKTLTCITKRAANNMLINSLFKPVNGGTLIRERYCSGKYLASIKTRPLQVSDDVLCLWAEPRRDADGNYFALYCLSVREAQA